MRVGLVTNYMPPHLGGLEQIAESLFNGYLAEGLEARWVSSRVPSEAPRRDGGRIRVATVNVIERLSGIPVPIWGIEGWRELEDLVRWADVLHVLDCLYLPSALAVLLARRHRRPVVLSQNIGFVPYPLRVVNLLEAAAYRTLGRAVLRGASHVVMGTRAASEYCRPLLGSARTSVSEFPVGIDTELYRPATPEERRSARLRLGLPGERPLVLFAARLVEKKGVPLVLEAARHLPDLAVLVMGSGPLARLLPTAGPNVLWRPPVPPAEMPAYYRAADCVLLPSHGEGLPLVVQEGMASGLPVVVAQDEPFARPLLEAGVCQGAPRAATAVATAVRQALAAAATLGPAARHYAEAHWGRQAMLRYYVGLFRRLLAEATS